MQCQKQSGYSKRNIIIKLDKSECTKLSICEKHNKASHLIAMTDQSQPTARVTASQVLIHALILPKKRSEPFSAVL